MDKLFLEQTKCLYLQPGPSVEMKEELSSFVLGNGSSSSRGSSNREAIEAINKYKPHVRKNWVTNPVQVDPRYWYFLDGNRATDEFNPVKEFPQGFLTQDVIFFMSEPPPDILSAETDEEKEKAFKSNSLASNVIRYYWHVGRAVADMLGKTAIEIALGSVISFSSDRECSALPTKYHRITLSNITDYMGMQSVFITLAPLLSLKSKSVTPCIQSNCLLNTGLWKSHDDYIFSTTALGYKEAEQCFISEYQLRSLVYGIQMFGCRLVTMTNVLKAFLVARRTPCMVPSSFPDDHFASRPRCEQHATRR